VTENPIARVLSPAPRPAAASRAALLANAAGVLALAGLWLWLFRPVLSYLAIVYGREDFRTNQWALAGVAVLVVLRLRDSARSDPGRARLDLTTALVPSLHHAPLALALGGASAYLAVERYLDVNTLSATLFGLATYGLVGLWLPPRRWRGGLPAALLLVGTLPFGEHLQTFVGYPLRIATAALVRDGLAAAGVGAIGIDTILVLENGVSQVDLPCSGVKSLWTGMLFLLAATWIERRPLDRRWLGVAAAMAALLFAANFLRVALLVLAGQVAGWPRLAEMLHVPLGVLGFVAACGAAARWLRGSQDRPAQAQVDARRVNPRAPNWQAPRGARDASPLRGFPPLEREGLPSARRCGAATELLRQSLRVPPIPALLAVVLLLNLLYAPRSLAGLQAAPPAWDFPAGLAARPLPLKPDEVEWLTRDGAESAGRFDFRWRGLRGSMTLVTSATWRAHHRPERCFEVYGLTLDDTRAHLVRPDFPLRVVALGDGRRRLGARTVLSAAYWFQSPTRTTDDFGTRIWADLSPRRDRWVMVSILFDGVVDPGAADVRELYLALHGAVARHLKGASS